MAQTIHGRDGITLPAPPAVDAIPVADDYFGTKIVDNYRWLEDAKSPETRAFIDAQNAYTTRYLKQARIRDSGVGRSGRVWKTCRTPTCPFERGNILSSGSAWPANSSSPSMCATAGLRRVSPSKTNA